MAKSKKTNPNTTDTLIGEKSVVEGKIISKASLRIEGKVIGDIECEGDIMIGKGGEVHSNIHARNVMNAGLIDGAVVARGMLTITASGSVSGDIQVKSLSIADGGVFHGSCKMNRPQTQRSGETKNKVHALPETSDTADAEQKRMLHKLEKKSQEKTKAAAGR